MEAPPAPSPRSPEAAGKSPTASPSAAAAATAAASVEPPETALAVGPPPPSSPSPAEPPPLQQPPLCVLPEVPPLLVVAAAVPVETHFASREQLLAHVHAFTLRHGYAVVIQKSNVPRGQLWLRCDLGGSYRSAVGSNSSTNTTTTPSEASSRKRKSSSRLRNCPFQLYARRLPDARWLLKVQNAAHNHAVDPEQLVAHPVARRLSLAQKQLVDALTNLGARPAHIVEKLKEQFPDKPVKVQDIYNARNYIRRERGAGRDPFSRSHNGDEDEGDGDGDGDGEDDEDEGGGGASDARASGAPDVLAGSAADAPTSRQVSPSPSTSISGVAASVRLQTLLQDASAQFPAWQPRTQKQFLYQLEVLLGKCGKAAAAASATPPPTQKETEKQEAPEARGSRTGEDGAETAEVASATESTSSSSSRSRSRSRSRSVLVDTLASAVSSESPLVASPAPTAAGVASFVLPEGVL